MEFGIVVYCRGGIASYLEEKYVAEYSCRDHTLYDISASSILKQCEKAFFSLFTLFFYEIKCYNERNRNKMREKQKIKWKPITKN